MDINRPPIFCYLLGALLLVMGGCSSSPKPEIPAHINELDSLTVFPADVAPEQQITLTRETEYGDTTGVILGQNIADVDVDSRQRVYLSDYSATTVHVYNPDGSFLRDLGREGAGPGEIQMLGGIEVSDSLLHIFDWQQEKIAIYNLTSMQHEYDRSISLVEDEGAAPNWRSRTQNNGLYYRPSNFFVRRDGSYLVVFSSGGVGPDANLSDRTYEFSLFDPAQGRYLRHDLLSLKWTGGVLVHEVSSGALNIKFGVPYKRRSQFDYANGRLVTGWTEEFLFKYYDGAGNYQKAVYHPLPKVDFSIDSLFALPQYEDQSQEAFRSDTIPQTWPAFNNLKLDDESRLWVSRFVRGARAGIQQWNVLSPTGKLLARFNWPVDRSLQAVRNGYAYTLENDPETGVSYVVRYRIEM